MFDEWEEWIVIHPGVGPCVVVARVECETEPWYAATELDCAEGIAGHCVGMCFDRENDPFGRCNSHPFLQARDLGIEVRSGARSGYGEQRSRGDASQSCDGPQVFARLLLRRLAGIQVNCGKLEV